MIGMLNMLSNMRGKKDLRGDEVVPEQGEYAIYLQTRPHEGYLHDDHHKTDAQQDGRL